MQITRNSIGTRTWQSESSAGAVCVDTVATPTGAPVLAGSM